MHRRVAKVDHHGNPVLLESRQDMKSTHCSHDGNFHLLRYRGMSRTEVNVAVRAQLKQAQRLARARARAAE